ncbi:MAG: glutamine-hydrolyzing carbamoyl-phosphate synthase small subunit [Elusimicrobiota bacterium]|jgi:carbamoyl-phosphate synthase small subunit
MKTPAWLALEDGTVFRGFSCGAQGENAGELVFNTSMTGYQEVLTDPSYKGQLVAMTYPQIGNYGITQEDDESSGTALSGFVVRELCRTPSNWRCIEPLDLFLRRRGIPAIEGIDTRSLTILLRKKGALRAVLSTFPSSERALVRKAKAWPSLSGKDLASQTSCREPYAWTEGLPQGLDGLQAPPARRKRRVLVLDFGVKRGILRCLVSAGCEVLVMPAKTDARALIEKKPDGVLLSNGPGDPEPLHYAIETVRGLLDARIPLFGICLGHQLLGLALGAKTYKLGFGHHGANHPVMETATGKIDITSQNHGFCVDERTLPEDVRATHINLHDRTCEGLAHAHLPAFSVQYHPEACAGPRDARALFLRFVSMMDSGNPAAARAKEIAG